MLNAFSRDYDIITLALRKSLLYIHCFTIPYKNAGQKREELLPNSRLAGDGSHEYTTVLRVFIFPVRIKHPPITSLNRWIRENFKNRPTTELLWHCADFR